MAKTAARIAKATVGSLRRPVQFIEVRYLSKLAFNNFYIL